MDENATLTELTDAVSESEVASESEIADQEEETSTHSETDATEKESVIDGDLCELREEFPELANLSSVTELANPIRYAALRDLGLSPAEAYILTSRRRAVYDNRSHLTSSVPASAKSPESGLTGKDMAKMREMFGDMTDAEIHKLYKKVTK